MQTCRHVDRNNSRPYRWIHDFPRKLVAVNCALIFFINRLHSWSLIQTKQSRFWSSTVPVSGRFYAVDPDSATRRLVEIALAIVPPKQRGRRQKHWHAGGGNAIASHVTWYYNYTHHASPLWCHWASLFCRRQQQQQQQQNTWEQTELKFTAGRSVNFY